VWKLRAGLTSHASQELFQLRQTLSRTGNAILNTHDVESMILANKAQTLSSRNVRERANNVMRET
jgi:hypothetical protein